MSLSEQTRFWNGWKHTRLAPEISAAPALGPHPYPSIAGIVRLNRQSRVGFLHLGHVVSLQLAQLEQRLQVFGHARFVIFGNGLVRARVQSLDSIQLRRG